MRWFHSKSHATRVALMALLMCGSTHSVLAASKSNSKSSNEVPPIPAAVQMIDVPSALKVEAPREEDASPSRKKAVPTPTVNSQPLDAPGDGNGAFPGFSDLPDVSAPSDDSVISGGDNGDKKSAAPADENAVPTLPEAPDLGAPATASPSVQTPTAETPAADVPLENAAPVSEPAPTASSEGSSPVLNEEQASVMQTRREKLHAFFDEVKSKIANALESAQPVASAEPVAPAASPAPAPADSAAETAPPADAAQTGNADAKTPPAGQAPTGEDLFGALPAPTDSASEKTAEENKTAEAEEEKKSASDEADKAALDVLVKEMAASGISRDVLKTRVGSCAQIFKKLDECSSYQCQLPSSVKGEVIDITIGGMEGDRCAWKEVRKDSTLSCSFGAGERGAIVAELKAFLAKGDALYKATSPDPIVAAAQSVRKVCADRMASAGKPAAESIPAEERALVEKIAEQSHLATRQKSEEEERKRKEADRNKKAAVAQVMKEQQNRAYLDHLNEMQNQLPADQQLSKATRDTMKKVQTSVVEQGLPSDEKPSKLEVNRGHQKEDRPQKNSDGVRRSDSSMDIAVRENARKQDYLSTQVRLESAYKALMAGQTEAAIGIYKQVLVTEPKNQTALFGMATAYHRNGQFDRARQIYTELLQLDPNNIEALNNFLVLAAEEAPDDALVELKKLERLNSGFSPVAAQIGMIYYHLDDLDNAARYLNRAVSLSPENITYKYNLAVIYDKLGRRSQAVSLYQQVIQASETGGAALPVSINALRERLAFISK